MEQALAIYPNYFDALDSLGREYTQRKEYEKALPYLIKAIDINNRSFSSFYALAYCCFQLKHNIEAIEAAHAATVIQPNSANAQLLYGTVLRISGNLEKAEKALLQARKINKETPIAEVCWQLALLYNKLGRNKDAISELEMYLKIQPNAPNKEEIKDLIIKLKNSK